MRRTNPRRVAVAALLLVLTACAASGPPPRPPGAAPGDLRHLAETMDWAVQTEMDRAEVPGVAVALVSRDGPIWSKGYGVTHRGGDAVGPATPFRVGSVSKPVTAALVARLAAAGKVGLDQPVAALLPGFAPRSRFAAADPVTPRMLLAHHSGLPSDLLAGMWSDRPAGAEASAALAGQAWLTAPPGTSYKYSNLGYGVLGRLVELAAGRPFAEAAADGLLRPLGMASSSFGQPPAGPRALPHRGGRRIPEVGLREASAGALWSSADDMGRFLQAMLSGGLPAAELLREQFPAARDGLGQVTGLGWMLAGNPVPGVGETAWHNGTYPGYHAHVALLPAEGLGVVVLANGEDASAFAMRLGRRALALALESRTGRALPEPAPPPAPVPAAVPGAALDAVAGRYVVMGALTAITRRGDHLETTFQGRTIELLPLGGGRFAPRAQVLGMLRVPLEGLSVRFADGRGRRLAVLEGTPEPLPFERVEPAPLPPAWRARLGTYALLDPDGQLSARDIRLAEEDGILVLRMRVDSPLWGADGNEARIALRPEGDGVAVVAGQGMGEGGVVEAWAEGGQALLSHAGFRLARTGP